MTIKRNGDKVLLKGGKVSCSCCEGPPPGECCMYPSEAYFNDEFTIDDLPDTLVMSFFGDTTVVSKTTDKFTPYDGTFGDGEQATISISEDEPGPWGVVWGGNSFEFGPCLINGDGGLTPGDDNIEDQFADTYTVTVSVGSQLVERIDLCHWRGDGIPGQQESTADLYYNGLPDLIEIYPPYKWIVVVGEGGTFGVKQGDQNTPVGSYSGILSATVS